MRAVPLRRYLVFGAIATVGVVADLLSKSWVFGWLGSPPSATYWIWDGVVGLQTSLNEGALFGLGQGRTMWFAVLSVAALVGVLVWLFVAGAARDLLLTVALGCVSAGILGNLYDRRGLPGLQWNYADGWHEIGQPVYAVRDWILVMIGPWTWPNFNVADSLLVCGAMALAWHAYHRGDGPAAHAAAEGPPRSNTGSDAP